MTSRPKTLTKKSIFWK